jgi:MFS family permease
MVAMNLCYSVTAYTAGKISQSIDRRYLLAVGLCTLIASDIVLAQSPDTVTILIGLILWGIHLGLTQGLLATMVADTAPVELRGTAFGFFNLASGIAMLAAGIVAGTIWEYQGPSAVFYLSAVLSISVFAFLRKLPARSA